MATKMARMWPKRYRFPAMMKSISVSFYPWHETATVAREVINRTVAPSIKKQYPDLTVNVDVRNDGKPSVVDFVFDDNTEAGLPRRVDITPDMTFEMLESFVERQRAKLEVDVTRTMLANEPQAERELPPQ